MGPKKACFPLLLLTVFSFKTMFAQESKQIVRLAKIEIDSSQLQDYKTALKEEIETSVRLEPGVLTLYAVQEKGNPSRRFMQIQVHTKYICKHLILKNIK